MIRSESQTLITGCYRSGTEYITQLLGNQPDLTTTMYVTNFMRYYWGRYDPIDDRENYYRLVYDAARRTKRRWGREIDAHAVIDDLEAAETVDYATVYDLLMSDLVLTDTKRHWAEKIQLVWTKIPAFVDSFENGRAIVILRDPRSVLASFKNYTYEPEPAYLGAIFNMLDVLQRSQRYTANLDDDHFHVMRYEDVMRAPEPTLEAAFEFLDLSHDHDLLDESGWTDPSGDPWHANSAFDEGEEFDVEASLNRWRNRLEEWEVALCEWVVGDVMQDFGYDPATPGDPDEGAVDVLREDEQLSAFLSRWQETGAGVEAFPSDPLDSANWAENAE